MKTNPKPLLKTIEARLQNGGIENFRQEAYYLLHHRIPVNRGEILLGKECETDAETLAALDRDIEQRLSGTPLQYLLGKWEFYGLEFLTLPGVLIPRPETELLIDTALPLLRTADKPRIIDLCCGSGCIGLTLAKLLPTADVTLFDISAAAVDATERNAALLGVGDRVHIVQGDILIAGTNYFPDNMFDFLISNPPYIKTDDLPALSDEVKNEPIAALDGGVDGLTFYRAIADGWRSPVKNGSPFLLEAGFDTASPVANLFAGFPFTDIQISKDLSGKDRMISARLCKE